jgi:dolichol-phosphate mannosyltransferase
MKTISVVIPFFNEGHNVDRIYQELVAMHQRDLPGYALQVVLMDNHSADDSFERARAIAARDARVTVIRLSRNFGYQANILTGLFAATGDAVVQLDADGEDDPTLIPRMVELWEAGNRVVYGVRRRRAESWVLSLQRKAFYRLLNMATDLALPVDAGDFRLLDRQVVEALRACPESHLYVRGLVSFAGFQQAGFEYDRRPRYSGDSRFSYLGYWRLAWDAITSFSDLPLRLATWCGVLLAGGSLIAMMFYLCYHFVFGTRAPGFTTIVLVLFFLAGAQFLFLGLLGTYIGRIFIEVKRRPRSIVETIISSPPEDSSHKGSVSAVGLLK